MPPEPEAQIRFLVNLQRLLGEGQFVATYKYALLLALADISVEEGDDSGSTLRIPTRDIAEKFVKYYWRQSVPYATGMKAQVLQQNTGRQAKIIRTLENAHVQYGDSMATVLQNKSVASESSKTGISPNSHC
jgi:hypothetical protein